MQPQPAATDDITRAHAQREWPTPQHFHALGDRRKDRSSLLSRHNTELSRLCVNNTHSGSCCCNCFLQQHYPGQARDATGAIADVSYEPADADAGSCSCIIYDLLKLPMRPGQVAAVWESTLRCKCPWVRWPVGGMVAQWSVTPNPHCCRGCSGQSSAGTAAASGTGARCLENGDKCLNALRSLAKH